MKTALIIVVVVALLIPIALFVLAQKSKTIPELGLHDGRFQPCIYSTNCVNSMEQGEASIAPLQMNDVAQSWTRLPEILVDMGGQIEQQSDHYLWVTFSTKWFGFVDDMELLLDADNQLIHVRSASRVGRSDFGVNRERVEQLRIKMQGQR
jgi:uncharacterized protein (DUF1499 family)